MRLFAKLSSRPFSHLSGLCIVLALVLAWPARPAAAAGPTVIDPTTPDLATLIAHYQKTGLPQIADSLKNGHRVTTPLPAPAKAVRYGIVNRTSSVWAGYIADMANNGNWVSEARGFFTVSPTGGGNNVASWTGIGGFNGQNLWQTGVDQTLMLAWTELYPAGPQYWYGVHAGDLMFSDVFSNGNGTYTLVIDDYTTGQNISGTAGCCPDNSTGEWITEDPGAATPIPFFNQFQFTYSVFFINGLSYSNNIDSPYAQQTWDSKIVLGGSQCITPGGLGADHQSFWMYWGC